MRHARVLLVALPLLLLAACGTEGGGDEPGLDAGALRADASGAPDADAPSSPDAAEPTDASLPADASAPSDAGEPPDASAAPDTGTPPASCSVPSDCPVLACQTAACTAQRCAYQPIDMDACTLAGTAGFCRAGECRTDVRHTRALAVITDFSDRVLEDYFGTGFASEADLRASLDEMEKHWWWASLGTHRTTWDVVRVRLAQSSTSFTDWVEFRDAAAQAVQDTVDASLYDADQDGIVDAAYFVVSLGTAAPDWAMGGMSRHKRINLFVDGQDSLSVRQRAIGNFNHEFGHCLGLPDLYGTYGTIYWLSLMHDSWPVPPMGLSAYDRIRLGWMSPTEITQTTRGVEVTLAESSFSAVRIPGPRSEAFLVEYRRRPTSGYGSKAPAHDGLAVYHVIDGATQAMNPPLLKLEPADGALTPGQTPAATDLWRPGDGPFVGRSSLTGEDVFRLENIVATATGRRFDVVLLGTGGTAPVNLLQNGSFETGTDALPDGWTTASWLTEPDTFGREALPCRDGSFLARITNTAANDAAFEQSVGGLTVGAGYLLCGWLRGEQIENVEGGGIGANVTLVGTWTQASLPFGTVGWTRRCVGFAPDTASVRVGFRLGFYGSTVTGSAFADDLSLEKLIPAF